MHDDKYIDIIELFDSHLDRFVEDDEVIVFDDIESKDNHVDVYWIKPNLEYRPYSILVTCGMSRFPMILTNGNKSVNQVSNYLQVTKLIKINIFILPFALKVNVSGIGRILTNVKFCI